MSTQPVCEITDCAMCRLLHTSPINPSVQLRVFKALELAREALLSYDVTLRYPASHPLVAALIEIEDAIRLTKE